jgi:hypothetical protein
LQVEERGDDGMQVDVLGVPLEGGCRRFRVTWIGLQMLLELLGQQTSHPYESDVRVVGLQHAAANGLEVVQAVR